MKASRYCAIIKKQIAKLGFILDSVLKPIIVTSGVIGQSYIIELKPTAGTRNNEKQYHKVGETNS